jgi:hypothetical protein
MRLVDTVKLATTTDDVYGDKTVTVLTSVKSLFNQRTAVTHVDNADGVVSDAIVYLDPKNPVVLDNAYRLEGMYIIAQPFGQDQEESWYRITSVSVGQRKLLNNAIDNIYCRLDKVAGLPYVPNS